MKFSAVKKILTEDFPAETKSWLGKLLDPLNNFMDQTSSALSRGLTLKENMNCQVVTTTVLPAGSTNLEMSLTTKRLPLLVAVGSCIPTDNTTPSAACSIYWVFNDHPQKGRQIVYTLFGLDAAKTYTLTLIVLT